MVEGLENCGCGGLRRIWTGLNFWSLDSDQAAVVEGQGEESTEEELDEAGGVGQVTDGTASQ